MQYSMNDHKNQPVKKSIGKMYLWIGIEKSGTQTHTSWCDIDAHKHWSDMKMMKTNMYSMACVYTYDNMDVWMKIKSRNVTITYSCVQAVMCMYATWTEDYPGGALWQGGIAVPT